MKLIKKLTTILFTFMMVLSATTMVFADETASQTSGVSSTDKGTLTINGALKDEDYKVYRIFDLESYNGTNYSYKVVNAWNNFFGTTGEGKTYITLDTDGYIQTNSLNDTNKAEFAQKALKYAKDNSVTAIAADGTITVTDARPTANTITYSNLPLGYYLVDSSVGTLCSLNTTNLNATINEKNSVPTVKKGVRNANTTDAFVQSNHTEIGQVVEFETIITVGDGPLGYILHDKMDEGLTYDSSSLKVEYKTDTSATFADVDATNYTATPNATDGHTFDIKFEQTFLNTLKKGNEIRVTYKATLNGNANSTFVTGATNYDNKNTTHLTYGDKSTSSNNSETNTLTFSFYINKVNEEGTGLKDAVFTINRKDDAEKVKLVKVNDYDATNNKMLTYRLATNSDAAVDIVTEITTPDNGQIRILGLNQGIYEINEKTAPKGYNKLTKAVSVEIKQNGVAVNGTNATFPKISEVKIVNKTGTVLPSTGGVGTTMMYIVGAALLIGSGVMLITKKNAK